MSSQVIQLDNSNIASPIMQMSLTDRMALIPGAGTLVYDSTLRCLFTFDGNRWFPAQSVDPMNGLFIEEDWANGNIAGNTAWGITGSAGADAGNWGSINQNAAGQVYIQQSNPAPGYSTLYYINSFTLGASSLFFDARVYVQDLSTGAQEFTVEVGFGNEVNGTAFSDGIYFMYDRATDGAFWSCKTAYNGFTTKTVTTVPLVASTYQTLSVAYYNDSVKFYINNVLVATHTTLITIGVLISPKLRIIKTVGNDSARLINDFFTTYMFFTNRRS